MRILLLFIFLSGCSLQQCKTLILPHAPIGWYDYESRTHFEVNFGDVRDLGKTKYYRLDCKF